MHDHVPNLVNVISINMRDSGLSFLIFTAATPVSVQTLDHPQRLLHDTYILANFVENQLHSVQCHVDETVVRVT